MRAALAFVRLSLRRLGVARALRHLHGVGILHRDVKPENVLLSEVVAVVTDFGIAKALAAAAGGRRRPGCAERARDPDTLTQVGIALDTPGCMAPEQAAADANIDHRADLSALGVVAHELLAGRHPFTDRRGAPQLLLAHLTQPPVALATLAPLVDPAVGAIAMQCLAKDPSARRRARRRCSTCSRR